MPAPSTFDIKRVIRPNILKLEPYRCARDDYSEGILLDANENSFGPVHQARITQDAAGAASIAGQADHQQLHRYPDPMGRRVKQRVLQLRPSVPSVDNVFLGVGSDEVIDLLVRITCQPGRDSILVTPPTYGMYKVVASINDVGVVKVPLVVEGERTFQLDVDAVIERAASDETIKLVWLCSPGNPTGTRLDEADVRRVLESGYRGLVVVDEAYVDFMKPGRGESFAKLVGEYPNVFVMQTMSKSFGLAGIRMGIGMGSAELVQHLNNTKAPYSLSTLALDVAHDALSADGIGKMRQVAASLCAQRDEFLIPQLQALPHVGEIVGGNDANFVLCRFVDGNGCASNGIAKRLYTEMAENRGLVVRYRGGDYGCEGCLRITVGTPDENRVVIATMRALLDAEA
ncbi:histidinol-phosphate transaminase [Coemansia sp. RSA 1722]|nr:histidinol-phosphate transaminase [Coemansia sp. RSA 486]KAJ2237676.1 histidinol-phosphate transaminase [Coemansia sp. RSA 485]KAJ2600458.1 histidinol-phosphate transaminase [Coemansia sp. RSA 1721]KAJ2605695.1 histidinol-phosphate transaminase [Coemansia sp. RSA 1722]KAJ2638986.1 histidinol-phosphate transaminase [Coemansia sp. RSA 1286]